MSRKMNVHEGLAKIKLYDKKINKEIENAKFFGISKKDSSVLVDGKPKQTFTTNAKAQFDSIMDLINERDKIKRAIIKSNATTNINVAGITLTVAEAIELKDSIEYKQNLLITLTTQKEIAETKVLNKNEQVDRDAVKLAEASLSSEDSKDFKAKFIEEFKNNNSFVTESFKGVDEEIQKLDEFIDNFLCEVDFALSTSNATTVIEID